MREDMNDALITSKLQDQQISNFSMRRQKFAVSITAHEQLNQTSPAMFS